MSNPLRVLLVEDSEDDATLIAHEIMRGGYEPFVRRVETAQDMKEALAREKWDVVVSDYIMPKFDGLSAFRVLQESKIDLPFIVVSGSIGEDIAVDAMRAGVHDYIMKNNLTRLVPAIAREMREAGIRWEQKMDEIIIDELASYPQRYPNPIIEVEPNGVIHYMNPRARQLFPTIMQEGFLHPFLNGLERIWDDLSKVTSVAYEREVKVGNTYYHQSIYYIDETKNARIYALNVTKRKEMEQDLAESENRYRTLVEMSPDAILMLDLQGRIVFGNKAMLAMRGASGPQSIIGLPFEMFVDPVDWHRVWDIITQSAYTRDPAMAGYTMLDLDNRRFAVELRVTSIHDENHKPRAYIGIIRDISCRASAPQAAS
ncbi:MAG TPA: PAS domain S-box protein [Candidatus Omnitrophota bacterium]|nr:PAS domain S-box protein [Candidatus Omnitrophota bacterium]